MPNKPTQSLREEVKGILGEKETWLKALHLLNPDAQINDESYDITVEKLLSLFSQEQKRLLLSLIEKGHGGGNWRRLLDIELGKYE